jgi:pilus assembly protein CpaF
MRRFIFGEILGKEAMTVMEAMNTGHIGLTTMHASNAADAVERIIMMCLRTDRSVSPEYLGKLITRTLNVVIYMEDLKIMEIVEVHDYTDGKVQVRKLFERVDGQLKTKLHPSESLGLNVEVERNIRVV